MRFLLLVGCVFLFSCKDKNTNDVFPEADENETFASSDECGAQLIKNQFIVKWESGHTTLEYADSTREFVDDFLEPQLEQIAAVEYNRSIGLYQTPNLLTPKFNTPVNWGFERIRTNELLAQNIRGQNVLVAVIDSGVDITHPQLESQIYVNPNEVINGKDDDGNGLIDDVSGYDFFDQTAKMTDPNGHGTHVAGIIAASHTVGNVSGVAPDAKILPLKFMNGDGIGDLDSAIASIEYARDMGAQVINASWGGEFCSTILRDTIDDLSNHNVLFVAASGNSSKYLDDSNRPDYPAAFQLGSQLVVGATTPNDRVVGFSNIGIETVNLLAPGFEIISTVPSETKSSPIGDEVALSGTSMATPFVAGAAALLWSHRPESQYFEIKQALLEGVVNSPDSRYPYPVSSRGRLDIPLALQSLQEKAE